ncbi:alpha-L-rhamnosidase [Thozetella sp. PMI_491]|nr:alpha-L-rhamnosidase [Thozetella sp. PMI_491]
MMLLALLAVTRLAAALSVETGSLRTEGAPAPLGIHATSPRLSWRLSSDLRGDSQAAYQVQAASSTGDLNNSDLWDSGRVASTLPFALYDGTALSSRKSVSWRVRVWDVNNSPSTWSEVTSFEMGLLQQSDWEADWITNSEFVTGTNALPMFTKEFDLSCEIQKARLYITGLGVFQAEINGKAVNEEVLGPGYSTVNRTVLYRTYDVTKLLRSGTNVLGVELGKGTYDAEKGLLKRYMKFIVSAKPLVLKSQLELTCNDGKTQTMLSDGSWLTTVDGPLLESSWYGGEEFDARRIIPNWSAADGNRSTWKSANVSTGPPGPPGEFINQVAPPLQITEIIPAKSVKQVGSQWVYDFGVNYAGWYTFTMNATGRAGTRIVFYPAENITDAGAPDQASSGSPIFDAYTMAGLEFESFTPKFMYHGSQYIAVNTTWAPSLADMTGKVIRAVNEPVSFVSTSNPLFNKIHQIIDRAIKSNMHSVLTDCPTREKLGWLEQDHLAFEPVARGYDIQAYGHDFVRTMADAQAVWGPAGLIPATAPEYVVFDGKWDIYRKDPNWGNAMIRFPLYLYRYYGDTRVLEDYYPIMVQYMDYLATRQISANNPVIDDGGLADWESIDTTVPTGLTNTYAYQQAAAGLKAIAKALRKCADAKKWATLEASIKAAFHSTWFNATGKAHYSANSQGANALALDMGAVPADVEADVFDSLLDSLEVAGWAFTVGEIGLPALFRVLMAKDRNDVVHTLMAQTRSASYGYQIEHGATSLWEHWDGNNAGVGSLNHFMYGFGDMWLHRLSGLAPANRSVAWNVIDYAPIVVGDLTSASASYRTPAGYANASWVLDGKSLTYDIVVPVGSRGVVSLRGEGFTESGISIPSENGKTELVVGSGSYTFRGIIA